MAGFTVYNITCFWPSIPSLNAFCNCLRTITKNSNNNKTAYARALQCSYLLLWFSLIGTPLQEHKMLSPSRSCTALSLPLSVDDRLFIICQVTSFTNLSSCSKELHDNCYKKNNYCESCSYNEEPSIDNIKLVIV